ncbi:MAG: viperin family antiviral radical SAM protein [Promethearchaeota archaeon]
MKKKLPNSINFHITQRCNYKCDFCFSTFDQNSHELSEIEQFELIKELTDNGCEKLNFAGGEPTLVQNLPNLIEFSKDLGVFTSLISNGTGLTKKFLKNIYKNIDLIGLSIDSSIEEINYQLGRCLTRNNEKIKPYSHINLIKNRVELINKYSIRLKINTVVTSLNWDEDLTDLISLLHPKRWKIFELTLLNNAKCSFLSKFESIKKWQFDKFIQTHKNLNPIVESNDISNESYLMITPNGKFFQNWYGEYYYSDSILEIGAMNAFEQIKFSYENFKTRDAEFFKNLIV